MVFFSTLCVVSFILSFMGRESSHFCLPLVEKCLVLWLWVEKKGLSWVFGK